MDLLSDIPDFVRSEICSPSSPATTGQNQHTNPFWKKWNDLGLVVEKIVTPETSFQELTLRDFLASLPLGAVQGIDANGFWSSTALPSNFRLTTHQHFQHVRNADDVVTFVLESPTTDVSVRDRIVCIPKITNAATFVFLLQHFQLPTEGTKRNMSVAAVTVPPPSPQPPSMEVEEDNDVVVTYSATPLSNPPSSVTPLDVGIVTNNHRAAATTKPDIDDCLRRWKRGDTNGRTGKPTVEKIAEMAGITQLDLKKWLATKGTTWTLMLTQHGFRDEGRK
jgi:hypothetical protein